MDISALNLFDAVILSIIFLSALFAFVRGFVKTIFSLLCWAFSLTCAIILAPYLVRYLEGVIDSFAAVLIISYLGGFAVVFILFAIIFGFIVKLAQPCCNSFIDRALGAALGFIRGTVIACMLFTGIKSAYTTIMPATTDDNKKEGYAWFTGAQTYNFLKISSSLLGEVMPEGMTGWVEKRAEEITRVAKIAAPGQIRNGSDADIDIVLSSDYMTIFNNIIDALPQDTLNKIDTEYGHISQKMLGAEGKLDFWERVISAYEQDVFKEAIIKDMQVPASDVEALRNEIKRLRADIKAIRSEGALPIPGTEEQPSESLSLSTEKSDRQEGYDGDKRTMLQRLINQTQQPE